MQAIADACRSDCVFALSGVVNYECYSMRHLIEGGYYFALLFTKCGVNLRAATKRGAASTRANMV